MCHGSAPHVRGRAAAATRLSVAYPPDSRWRTWKSQCRVRSSGLSSWATERRGLGPSRLPSGGRARGRWRGSGRGRRSFAVAIPTVSRAGLSAIGPGSRRPGNGSRTRLYGLRLCPEAGRRAGADKGIGLLLMPGLGLDFRRGSHQPNGDCRGTLDMLGRCLNLG